MKRIITIYGLVMFALTVITSQSVKAYEGDTHFDVMYHLSRSVGINDSVSKFFAIGNQYIDKGIISSPLLLAVQRQLFHFPGDLAKIEIEGHGAISIPATIFKSKLALAERNHAIGNYLISLGLKGGDLMLVALGMHIKMDTYGHAGHSNLLGHMEAGHNPDRAFLEAKKYEDMIRSMVQTLVSVKKLLPEEAIDNTSALKYLNQYSKQTHLKRNLTNEDMLNPTIISGVMLADVKFQGIYRENMFRKYEYKKIALRKIYSKFLRTGEINSIVTFAELFPDSLIQDDRLDVKDILKNVIMSSTDAEFLKAEGGKEIFNLKKLFGFNSVDIFNRKFQVEVERADFRLRELFNLQEQSKIQGDSFDTHLAARMEHEQEELLVKSIGMSAQFEYGSEEFIKMRSREIAEDRTADEISIKLTKDLVPLNRNEYIKQNFEGDTETRRFEVKYKASAYRMFRMKNWGVNFAYDDSDSLVFKIKLAIRNFKAFIKRTSTVKLVEVWEESAHLAAQKYMEMDSVVSADDKIEMIGFDKANKRDAFFKLLKYVGPAIFPWLTGYKSGFSYIQSVIMKAKLHAKDHEVEDMRAAVAAGKYKANLFGTKTSKKAVSLIRKFEASATIRCEMIFN
ncbi:MAG: hypothetical protein WA160_12190 [Pseudobdellovibrio sp.]